MNETHFYGDHALAAEFAGSIGSRIMQVYHEAYPNIASETEEKITKLFELCTEKLHSENIEFGFRFLRECLMEAGESYNFVIPEASDVEYYDYDKFTTAFLAAKIK